ncbi:MAG: hypothetical protein IPM92_15130 [Saprospiraceae bacterium]|nr:hypothetical protein [Saprospiraceae bacterium]
MRNSLYGLFIILLMTACNSKPTVVEPVGQTSGTPTPSAMPQTETSHKVLVEEVLQTSKYTYLYVKEGELSQWIAISKADVSKGAEVVYTGGLKMKAFQSSELNRTFDELLLVSNIKLAGAQNPNLFDELQKGKTDGPKEKIQAVAGAVKIAEIFSNPEKYKGKKIIVSGRCTKINFQIMGKNWIHLEDESGSKSTLTITSQDAIEAGRSGVFEGVIALNKDFGAGYKYDVIMEEAKLK